MTAPSIKEALERSIWQLRNGELDSEMCVHIASVLESALATLQPSGEGREAIASLLYTAATKQIPEDEFDGPATWDEINKKISDPWFQEHYPETIAELIATLKYYRVLADAILASGLVQDEAGIRADEREKCAKIAEKFGEPYALNTNTGAMMFRAQVSKIAAAISSARDGGAS